MGVDRRFLERRPARALRLSQGGFLAAFVLLTLLWSGPAQAAITFDAASNANTGTGTSSSLTFSHTVNAGSASRLVLVGVSIRASTSVSSVTYAGTALTFVGARNNSTNVRMEIWRLVAPATGANNVVVTLSSAARFVAGAASFYGVQQTTPLGSFVSNTGNDPTPTVNVTGVATGEVVFDTMAKQRYTGALPSAGGGQTQRWSARTTNATDDLNVVAGGSTEPYVESSTVTMSWTLDEGRDWTIGAVAIKPASPTAVKLEEFSAERRGDAVSVKWRTGHEVDNLGFDVYREAADGERVKVTSGLVAGSALRAGVGTVLTAGWSYRWQDRVAGGAPGALRYWLEDVDLDGTSTWHGSVEAVEAVEAVEPGGVDGSGSSGQQAPLLSELGRAPGSRGVALEFSAGLQVRAGLPSAVDSASLSVQRWLAGRPAVKLLVKEEGWYRVGQGELIAAGLDPQADPRGFRLFVDGREQAFAVVGESDGRFDGGDWLELYGTGLDTASTDRRVYWLTWGRERGRRIQSLKTGLGGTTGAPSFPFTVERKDRSVYFAAALGNGEADNFFGPVVTASAAVDQTLAVHHLGGSGPGAALEVSLQGVTEAEHAVAVRLNGAEVGTVEFSGRVAGRLAIAVPDGLLREGDNEVTLVAVGGSLDVSVVDSVRLTYSHRYAADGDALRFAAMGGSSVTVAGFDDARIRVLDLTAPKRVVELRGKVAPWGGGYAVTLAVPGRGERRLLAFVEGAQQAVAELRFNDPSRWSEERAGADLVVIGYGEFLGALEPLRVLRAAQGLTVALVNVEDLYDEHSYGHKDPGAIQRFLARARETWRRAPRYVLLVGDGSLDPRNYLGFGDFDYVPAKLLDSAPIETASDDWYADFDADGLAEMAVGRLPVRTTAEAERVVGKIVSGGSGAEGVVLVADSADGDAGFDFAGANAELATLVSAAGTGVEGIVRGTGPDPESEKAELLAALGRGAKLVSYAGHGSVDLWRGNFLTAADADSLGNGERLSVFVTMTCLNGYFQDPALRSLAEALLAADGGAVAVWASSGLSAPAGQAVMNRALFETLFGGGETTLGEAVMRAKAAATDGDLRRTWILFGDPAMPW